MKKRIKRIAPVQLGKVLATMYTLAAFIFVPIMLITTLVAPKGEGISPFFIVVVPIIYIVTGFIGGIILAAVYNISARWVGGMEIEFEE